MPRGLTVIFVVSSTLHEKFILLMIFAQGNILKESEWENFLYFLTHGSVSTICTNGEMPNQGWCKRYAIEALFIFFACMLQNGFVILSDELMYLRSIHALQRFRPRNWFLFSLCLKDLYIIWKLPFPNVVTITCDNKLPGYSMDISYTASLYGVYQSPDTHNTLCQNRQNE